MTKVDLSKFIIPVELDNTDENQKFGKKSFKTKDLVFLDSDDDMNELSVEEKITTPTDYAIANGAFHWWGGVSRTGKKGTSAYWLRSAFSKDEVYDVLRGGLRDTDYVDRTQLGISPTLHLNLSSIISAQSELHDFGKIAHVKDTDGKVIYHTIEFGKYPKTKETKSDEFENLLKEDKIFPTGKTYTGYLDNGKFTENLEYEYNGQKYVRVKNNRFEDGNFYSDGQKVPKDGYVWIKVEPITWIIRNWDEMPTSINPQGNGKATYIDVRTEESIMGGIPFYPNTSDNNISFWQNSSIRGFLNGINVNNITTNGNTKYTAPNGGDFTGKGFLQEAFVVDMDRAQTTTEENGMEPQVRRSRLDKLNPDTIPQSERRKMTDTEMISNWIEAGQSVLLRGPSGIGKTERIAKLYPDLIWLKLTNNMFPEKVVGSVNLQTGQNIPPDFAKSAILSEATDDEKERIKENIDNLYEIADIVYERSKTSDKKTVVMLDELLNVKPAVQSLVYSIVFHKFVESGKGIKLPDNTVVVGTGNQKKYSSAAEDAAGPLIKRFDHVLDMEPKVGEWLYEYAIPNNLHPAVIGYIANKYYEESCKEGIGNINYFYEEPEVGEQNLDKFGCVGKTNDPRGWTSISNMLYAFEEDLKNNKFVGKDVEDFLKTSLQTKLREEWATEFFDFYNEPTLSVEDVVEGKYTESDLPDNTNSKFACTTSLITANAEQVEEVRNFIRKNCDPEYLRVYDLMWAGDDIERIKLIQDIDEKNNIYQEFNNEPIRIIEHKETKSNYKTTLDEFFDKSQNKFIHCNSEQKAKILLCAFDKAGKKWTTGYSYKDLKYFYNCTKEIYYSNDGMYTYGSAITKEDSVFEFEDVNILPYLNDEQKREYDKIISNADNVAEVGLVNE